MYPSVPIYLSANCFRWASIIKNTTKRVGLVQSGPYHHFIEINLFSPWYSWKIVELALSNNHSLPSSIWTFASVPFPYFSNIHYVRCLLHFVLACAIWEESYRYIWCFTVNVNLFKKNQSVFPLWSVLTNLLQINKTAMFSKSMGSLSRY
jgi:hypothetical protein